MAADSTRRLVAGLFDMVDLGERKLKGFSIPVHAWRIASETDAEGRFDAQHGVATPLVGRAEELELLMQRWQLAQAGKGQAVLLSGEPGIGKSRLIAALLSGWTPRRTPGCAISAPLSCEQRTPPCDQAAQT